MFAALRRKYERILTLREAHARAANDPSFIEPDPRAAMAALAEEFPGALRELDRVPLAELERRIQALAAAEEDPSRVEGWMIAQHTFHRYARGALAVKRWLAERSGSADASDPHALEAELRRALPSLREEAALFTTHLDDIATPLRGRVMDVVYARTAGELGITERELRALLHG